MAEQSPADFTGKVNDIGPPRKFCTGEAIPPPFPPHDVLLAAHKAYQTEANKIYASISTGIKRSNRVDVENAIKQPLRKMLGGDSISVPKFWIGADKFREKLEDANHFAEQNHIVPGSLRSFAIGKNHDKCYAVYEVTDEYICLEHKHAHRRPRGKKRAASLWRKKPQVPSDSTETQWSPMVANSTINALPTVAGVDSTSQSSSVSAALKLVTTPSSSVDNAMYCEILRKENISISDMETCSMVQNTIVPASSIPGTQSRASDRSSNTPTFSNLMLEAITSPPQSVPSGPVQSISPSILEDVSLVERQQEAAEQGEASINTHALSDLMSEVFISVPPYAQSGPTQSIGGSMAYREDVLEAEMLRKEGEKGDADAQFELGCLYYHGQGVQQNDALASEWFLKAAEQGQIDAQCNIGIMYHLGVGLEQNDSLALEWCQKAAEQDDADAQCNLGNMYQNGHGVERNDAMAVKWWKIASQQGHADAYYNLGNMYYFGLGVEEQSDARAVECWQKAAEKGDADSQLVLGHMYEKGCGVPQQNDSLAVNWWKIAAEQGDAEAQNNLGVMYAKGLGVEQQSDTIAVSWYCKAAEQGHTVAQFNLGYVYQHGYGVDQIDELAVHWYRKAAEQGHRDAQCNLAYMYQHGCGVEQSNALAVRWWNIAAEQGDANAQFNLDILVQSKSSTISSDEFHNSHPTYKVNPKRWIRKKIKQIIRTRKLKKHDNS